MMFLYLWLIGCNGKIKSLYEEERTSALSVLKEVPSKWKPDIRLRISYQTINEMGQIALENNEFVLHTFFNYNYFYNTKGRKIITKSLILSCRVNL